MQFNSICFLAWNFGFFPSHDSSLVSKKVSFDCVLLCYSAILLLRIVFLYILHTEHNKMYLLMSWSVDSLSWSWSWHLLSCSHHWMSSMQVRQATTLRVLHPTASAIRYRRRVCWRTKWVSPCTSGVNLQQSLGAKRRKHFSHIPNFQFWGDTYLII